MASTVTVKLSDGKEYTLRLMGRALLELRQKHGVDILTRKGMETVSTETIYPIAALALRKTHPDVTEEYLLDNTDASDCMELFLGVAALVLNKPIEELRYAAENPVQAKAKEMQAALEVLKPLKEQAAQLDAAEQAPAPEKVQ